MNVQIKKLIKPIILVAVMIFMTCCIIKKPKTFDDYSSYVSYAISGVCILFVCYEKFLWRFIPWNRPPILKKEYAGTLFYDCKKKLNTKPISIKVKQTWLSVEITATTDINTSYTITGTIVKEHGVNILYYTYVTNPSAVNYQKNPIQYGTCRMPLSEANQKLKGKYWTTSQTVGDLEWEANAVDKH